MVATNKSRYKKITEVKVGMTFREKGPHFDTPQERKIKVREASKRLSVKRWVVDSITGGRTRTIEIMETTILSKFSA